MATSDHQDGFVVVASNAALEFKSFVFVQGEDGIENEVSFVVVAHG